MDSYIYGITALLPLAAAMLVFQVNPYHALVMRGILGATASGPCPKKLPLSLEHTNP